MTELPESVVIVGGGLAGFTLADSLRKRGYEHEIMVIEQEPALYDRPPLSKEAFVGAPTLSGLAFASEEQLAERRINVLVGRTVTAIDPDRGSATLDDGQEVAGGALVIATGGRARILTFPGNDLEVVHTLRTFADAARIRAAASPDSRILVVGAGLIGAELTASLRALGAAVTLIDPVETPLVRLQADAWRSTCTRCTSARMSISVSPRCRRSLQRPAVGSRS